MHRPGGRADMAPVSGDAPDVPAKDAHDDCRTHQSPPGSGEGSVEEDTRARDAETKPDEATNARPDEDEKSKQVRGYARVSRHDPFPAACRVRLLLSFCSSRCRFFPACAFRRARARAERVGAARREMRRTLLVTAAHAEIRRVPRQPSRRLAWTSARSMPARAKTTRAENARPELFRLDSADTRS